MRDRRPASTSPRSRKLRKRLFGTGRSARISQIAIAALLILPALVAVYLTSASAYLSTGSTNDRAWFWQNQLPQGNSLRAMSWNGSTDGWAVGVNGTVLHTADSGATWATQDPITKSDLTGVSFVSATTGWTVGTYGTIKKTTDGGSTWTTQTSGVASGLRAVSFATSNVGVVVGDTGATTATIRYTTDGGANWRTAATTSTVGLSNVEMVSATVGWAVGGSGALLKTVDGGASWTVRPSPTSAGLTSISFASGGTVGYLVGNAAAPNWTIYKTIDSGATWTAVSGLGSTGAVNLLCVDVLDANNVVVVGANGRIRRTTNAGVTWPDQSQNNIGTTSLRAVKLFDASRAYAIGDNGLMFLTTNAGASWFTQAQGSLATWLACDFADVNHGWAVGTNGEIMRTVDAGQTWQHQAAGTGSWRAVRFTSATSGWVAGDAGTIEHTTNGVDWVSQTSGVTVQLNGLWFTSATTGFAVGNSGTILKTTDGGATWVVKPGGTSQNLNAVWFANANTGFAVGTSGTIRRTTNAGETWTNSTSGTSQTLLAIRGVSASVAWASGNSGTVRETTDGGTNWNSVTAGAGTNAIRTIFFTTSNVGWLGANFGVVRATTDGGSDWAAQNAGLPTSTADPATGVNASWFSGDTGYLFGDAGVVRRTIDGGLTWSSLQYGSLSDLNSVMFADPADGWAAGAAGTMMHTSDSGQTWTQQKTGSTAALNQVWMTSALSGWAVGDGGTIRRTVNGGQTWNGQTSGVTVSLSSVGAADAAHAIAAGSGAVRYTTNGTTWAAASTSPTQPVTGLYMVDSNNAWAVSTHVSGNNVVWSTTDGGANWSPQATSVNANLWDVYFRDVFTGYAVGDAGVILKTIDGGATWVRRPTPTTQPLDWIRFADANTGWAVGASGVTLRTLDGGDTWTLRDSGTSQQLASVAFSGATRGWIVGANGTILQSSNLVPPTTSVTIDPPAANGGNSWYTTAPTITAVTSGGATTYYSWISAAGPFTTYTLPFPAIEGTQTLFYYSSDNVGNAEAVRSLTLKTDVTNPTVPGGVAVTLSTIGTSSAEVTWNPSTDAASGIEHYEVSLGGIYLMSTTSTSTVLTGLQPDTLYSVTIVSVDRAHNASDPSSPATVFSTKALDTAPYTTVLTADPFGPNGADGWYVTTPTVNLAPVPVEAPVPATYYSWVSGTGPWTPYTVPVSPPTALSTLYYYTAGAANGRADELPKSLAFKVDTTVPSQPIVNAVSTGYQSIQASWTAVPETPSGILRYDVYVDSAFYASVTSPIIDIVGLHKATPYWITVQAVSASGATSTPSPVAGATTDASPLPAAPGVVYAKAPTGATVYIDWTPSDDFVGAVDYRVWRSLDGTTYSPIATTTGGVADCSYIDSGLASSTRYWYAVSTVDSRGESSLSSTQTAAWPYTAPTTLRPQRPLNLTATGLGGTIFLQWSPSNDPAVLGYYVYRAPLSLAATPTTLTPVPVTTTGFFDMTIVDAEPYYYSVAAVDASGAISWLSVEAKGVSPAIVLGAGTDPHSFGNGASGCMCHATHTAVNPESYVKFPGATAAAACEACHEPAGTRQAFLDPLTKSKHPEGAAPTVAEPFTCNTCHVPLYKFDAQLNNLMRVNGSSPCVTTTDTPAGNGFCYKCHGTGSTLTEGDMTVFETSGHRTVPAPATGADITCDTCHESHSSRNTRLLKYEGYMVCMQCHTASATNPDQGDIYTALTLNDGANMKHPLLPQDQTTGARMTCQNCHNAHTTSATFPLVDPHNPSPSGKWTTARGDEKDFCFQCHNGQPLPTNAETQPWADAVTAENTGTVVTDVKTLYQTAVHGFGQQSDSTTATAYLRTDMGYKYGDVLECRACHDPHGTPNAIAIRADVKSASGDKTISGLITSGSLGGTQDYRFFCASCHDWSSAVHDSFAGTSTVGFPTNCAACHYFGSPVGGL